MAPDEREKRHQHNFMHVTTHTSQEWAATFVRYVHSMMLPCLFFFPFFPGVCARARYIGVMNIDIFTTQIQEFTCLLHFPPFYYDLFHFQCQLAWKWSEMTLLSPIYQLLDSLFSLSVGFYSKSFVLLFWSELNDTIVEAQLRTRQVPPLLPMKEAVDHYLESNNRLLILVNVFFLLIKIVPNVIMIFHGILDKFLSR